MTLARPSIPLEDRLIIALDVASPEEARAIVDELGDAVTFYKIGLGLQFRGGIELAVQLKKQGKKVFFDSKIHDVEATTRAAIESIAALGVDLVTLHGNTSVLREAVKARGNTQLKLFSVTVLTSLDQQDMSETGFTVSVEKIVEQKTRSAIAAGIDGVITSGLEAPVVRAIADQQGSNLLIITPGIRSADVGRDEQKRVVTPEGAIRAGADYIVMGRQILRASDRRAEARKVIAAMRDALG